MFRAPIISTFILRFRQNSAENIRTVTNRCGFREIGPIGRHTFTC